jgi:hypothetical protein
MKRLLPLCLLITSLNASASLNKWVDAEGKVHYSDTVPADATITKVRSSTAPDPSPPINGVATPKSIAEQEADWKKNKQSKEEAAKKAEQDKEATAIKQKNCEGARTNLATYENSPLIVSYNPQGERFYLDDAARKQKVDEAKKAVATYCK